MVAGAESGALQVKGLKMLTIKEFAEKYKIRVSKLRAIERDKLITFRPHEDSPIETIIIQLKKNNHLTAANLRHLILHPESLLELGDYRRSAKACLKRMGDVQGQAIAADQSPHILIDQAAAGDPIAVSKLARWIASIIPVDGCGYHYIAVRALLNVPDHAFDLAYRSFVRAMTKARKDPELEGMSETENRATRFFRKKFDL